MICSSDVSCDPPADPESLSLRVSAAQKVEEDEDDMADLQAWTTS